MSLKSTLTFLYFPICIVISSLLLIALISGLQQVNGSDAKSIQSSENLASKMLETYFEEAYYRDIVAATCHNGKSDLEKYEQCLSAQYTYFFKKEAPIYDTLNKTQADSSASTFFANVKLIWMEYFLKLDSIIKFSFLAILISQTISLFDFGLKLCGQIPKFGSLHQWIVDAPPVLGVCGTLWALVSFLATEDKNPNTDAFLIAFSTAATTTLYGGITSVLNQFLVAVNIR